MGDADDEALAAAHRLADACADVLTANLVAAVLHGSLTVGDFLPGTSDLDLLLVVERSLTSEEADALVDVVRAADPGPAGGTDLLVVTRRSAGSPADSPERELMVGRWPGSDGELEVERRDEHVPDLYPELSEVRAHGRSLIGPEPVAVVGEVPRDLVLANGVGWLRTWLTRTDDADNAVLMVLTACRIWRFALTRDHVSKSEAGRWALGRDPSLVGVEQALADRRTGGTPRIAAGDVEAVLRRVLSDRDRLVDLVGRIMAGGGRDEAEDDELLADFARSVPHPRAADLVFWPDQGEPTPEQVVDEALGYRPIEL